MFFERGFLYTGHLPALRIHSHYINWVGRWWRSRFFVICMAERQSHGTKGNGVPQAHLLVWLLQVFGEHTKGRNYHGYKARSEHLGLHHCILHKRCHQCAWPQYDCVLSFCSAIMPYLTRGMPPTVIGAAGPPAFRKYDVIS